MIYGDEEGPAGSRRSDRIHGRDLVALRRIKGLGATWAAKLVDLGVRTPGDLIASDLNALSRELPGVSVERLIKWRGLAVGLVQEEKSRLKTGTTNGGV